MTPERIREWAHGSNADFNLERAACQLVNEAFEEAAKAADLSGRKWHTDYKIGNGPHRASAHREGMSDGAEIVAEEIRALKLPEEK